jgi:hypothetical protein
VLRSRPTTISVPEKTWWYLQREKLQAHHAPCGERGPRMGGKKLSYAMLKRIDRGTLPS